MDFEHKVVAIPVTNEREMQQAVEALAAEGWQTFPNIPPVTMYHLFRAKARPEPEPAVAMPDSTPGGVFANAKMLIDENKVLVRSGVDGKLRDAAGTIVSEN